MVVVAYLNVLLAPGALLSPAAASVQMVGELVVRELSAAELADFWTGRTLVKSQNVRKESFSTVLARTRRMLFLIVAF
jgi:hypothetical protein